MITSTCHHTVVIPDVEVPLDIHSVVVKSAAVSPRDVPSHHSQYKHNASPSLFISRCLVFDPPSLCRTAWPRWSFFFAFFAFRARSPASWPFLSPLAMFALFFALPAFFTFFSPVLAAPIPLFGIHFGDDTEADGTPTPVSQSTITTDLLRPALFARTAYCPTSTIVNWTCGAPCNALPGIQVFTAGGNQGTIPFFYVASDPQSQSIVVVHEGTDPADLLSVLNDIEFSQVNLNSTLFPNAGNDTLVHDGFQDTQGRTADTILSTVQSALASTGYKNVLVTGHSLGAAVASLDAVMLKMALPNDVAINSVVFGLPRVGNAQWASLVDSLFPSFAHVTNQKDPVPTVPPQFLSFVHPAGEAHITTVSASTGNATMVQCPGQENEHCSDSTELLDSDIQNHLGPYFDGVSFGSSASGCS